MILDSGLVQVLGLEAGDTVRVFGRNFRVAGFASRLSNPLNGVSFLRLKDFARLRLRQPPRLHDSVGLQRQARLEQVLLGIRQAEIGEHVAARFSFCSFSGHASRVPR